MLYFVESLAGKRVVLTGASSGMGEQMAYHYARMGADILITARREYRLQEVSTNAICTTFSLYPCAFWPVCSTTDFLSSSDDSHWYEICTGLKNEIGCTHARTNWDSYNDFLWVVQRLLLKFFIMKFGRSWRQFSPVRPIFWSLYNRLWPTIPGINWLWPNIDHTIFYHLFFR